MKINPRAVVALSALVVVLCTTAAPSQAAAPKPGTACKTLGQKVVDAKLTYTCTKSGSKLVWSIGQRLALRATTKTLPAAVSGSSYRAEIEALGGTGYHTCSIRKGPGLPTGYSLNSKTCVISGIGEDLPEGTTKRISPPFGIVITDSGRPKAASVTVTFTITTYPSAFVITLSSTVVHCQVKKICNPMIATASGGIAPYSFDSRAGFLPIGIFIETLEDSARLSGIPSEVSSTQFEICVTDSSAREACKAITFVVDPTQFFLVRVNKSGDGQGRVSSFFGEIDCGQICEKDIVSDSNFILGADPAEGSIFTGWSGDCTGTAECSLDVKGNRTVTATFSLSATGTYAGRILYPDLSTPGLSGCWAESRPFQLEIIESEGGKIIGEGDDPFTGTRSGNTMTVTVNSAFGARGPYVWQWNGTTMSGTYPAFCYRGTASVLKESSFTFNVTRTSTRRPSF